MGNRLEGLAIVLVEDDADTCEMLVAALRREGAVVHPAATPVAGLALVESERPRVLITDIGLPGMSGYDLLDSVRRLGIARGGGVIAVAMTAYSDTFAAGRSLFAGFNVHLVKPIELDQLIEWLADNAGGM